MAELNVQPKRSSNWWIWLLLAVVAIALVIFLSRGCNSDENAAGTTSTTDSSESGAIASTTTTSDSTTGQGDAIDFNSPRVSYEEITDADIDVRGNNSYAIYSLGENVLFDVEKSTIKPDAESKLKQIASSLTKRFADSEIRIYGHADSTGNAADNKQLSEQRAESVKNWIMRNANVTENRISLYPLGESQPVASNATEEGKQQNRSVQIVARQR